MIGPSVVERLRGHRVLVIGDLMLDEYLRGDVHRVSPEAPVPVLDLKATEHRLGGAANTAANLARLGAQATVIGVVGDDDGARVLEAALTRAGIAARTCVDRDRPTTRKTRLVAGGHQIARVDAERRTPVAGEVVAALRAAIDAELAGAEAIVLSDYAKGVITRDVARAAIAAGRSRGLPVVVDPKQRDFSTYAEATVITPNLNELEQAVGHPAHTLDEIDAAARTLAPRLAGAALLVTRGADGMTLYRDGVRGAHVPAAAREVFDVTGAGDTVVATLTLALAAQLSLEEAMDLASLAAGISVSRRGTSTVGPDELAAAVAAARTV
ncbi:MAG TPA: D-glycero-beta-D-manno-heptose-7-phosphate kinase [Kofleriaceae bacterium]|nr:D-glycero-beta-D-manno-heptose-7-phosphate kinase [Kofleriaceae bacterium]